VDGFQRDGHHLEAEEMKKLRYIAAATAAALLLAGTAATAATAGTAGTTPSTAASAARTAATAKPALTVGVDLYVSQSYTLAQAKTYGERDLEYIAKTLGLRAVAICWDYNVPGQHANTVTAPPKLTPGMDVIQELTNIAKSDGLKVSYRAVFAIDGSNDRTQSIAPTNMKNWIASLLKTETPALKLAQSEHVSAFVAGTEMASIDGSPLWKSFFTKAAKLYKGALSYATWGGRPGTGGFFGSKTWPKPPTALIGVTAYPSIKLPPTTSVASLTKAWVSFLKFQPASVLRRTAIDEVGIPALDGAYADPWQWIDPTGKPNPAIQANWFDAACRAAGTVGVTALYFWAVNLVDNPASPFPSPVKFEGNPGAETAIRTCAAQAKAA
jgi:hypothetical protein